jgi:hypothetical protein
MAKVFDEALKEVLMLLGVTWVEVGIIEVDILFQLCLLFVI